MLTLADFHHPVDRRGFLRIGGLRLGGLTLASTVAAADLPRYVTGKSIVFVFQQGGPSQFETFDPKPNAPDGVRTLTGTIPTTIPGVRFGDSLPQLAQRADKLAIVRSFQTNNAEHNIRPIVSVDTLQANIGSLFSRVHGPVRSESGMPTNAVLFPQAVRADVTRGSARGDISATGALGAAFAPFVPGAGSSLQRDMRLNLSRERLDDRRALLASFGTAARHLDSHEGAVTLDRFQEQAYQMLLSNRVAEAMDLTREPASVRARYDTSRYVPSHGWDRAARGRRGYYVGQAKSIGPLMLMARRLCEAGCGFVTVHADYEGVWDFHADGENLNVVDGMAAIGRSFDHATAAFLDDVEARGLSDDIVLVCCGEMGRTPRINRNAGRDHWAKLAPLVLAGGGIRGGRVLGASTPDGGEPSTEAYGPKHLISTLLRLAFDPGQLRLVPRLNQIATLTEHEPIPGLLD